MFIHPVFLLWRAEGDIKNYCTRVIFTGGMILSVGVNFDATALLRLPEIDLKFPEVCLVKCYDPAFFCFCKHSEKDVLNIHRKGRIYPEAFYKNLLTDDCFYSTVIEQFGKLLGNFLSWDIIDFVKDPNNFCKNNLSKKRFVLTVFKLLNKRLRLQKLFLFICKEKPQYNIRINYFFGQFHGQSALLLFQQPSPEAFSFLPRIF